MSYTSSVHVAQWEETSKTARHSRERVTGTTYHSFTSLDNGEYSFAR